jgi:hypothetical protein
MQLSRNVGTHRGISALSTTFRHRSRSKSSEKSSTPTSPSSPKFSFKYAHSRPLIGFLKKKLILTFFFLLKKNRVLLGLSVKRYFLMLMRYVRL